MNAWIIAACLVAVASASPSGYGLHGHGHGVVVSGPSGVVTGHGPVGPTGPAHGHGWDDGSYYGDDGDDGQYHGEGAWGHGAGGWGGHGDGAWGGHHGAVLTHGAAIIAPSAHAVVSGPAHGYGLGLGLGHAGIGLGYGHGHGDGYVALGHHGVTVHGPGTVPAVVAGPSGKIVADGLYGVPHHHHHY